MTDPYRPVAVSRAGAARFPRERLLRAGLDEPAVDHLADRFGGMSPAQRSDLVRYVNGHSDPAIARRFGAGGAGVEAPTRDQLDDLHVPELRDRLAARGLPVSGRKDELVDRLLAAHEQGDAVPEQPTALTGDAEQPQTAAPVEQPPAPAAPAEQPQAPAQPAPAPAPTPEPAPAPQPAAEPAPTPVEQPATSTTSTAAEQPPATLPAGSPGAPAATDPAPAATPTPAAPAGGSTDTAGGTPA